MFEKDDIIFSYTRAQAIEDGVLVDVSETAREAGFKCPVAMTGTVWDAYVEPDARCQALGQSVEGRLWDVLWVLRNKATGGETVEFGVLFLLSTPDRKVRHRFIVLKAVCGPGDDGAPVITIMLPEED